ncbi:uncharacterized protein LAESUDRAFT_719998 [Laetiporus sulphureus 93-53]|uniref:Uncharacterized protein n=1 Tax=Laetiporus sulphureus 93-53 TaxID=1314785 RepID=A0A165HQ23_9APHY|nr:uncharacterized protein LAESUDRAFT_719998 [Laetiporus sulphureus 93-53]KZT12033.1 hypothetical protein LAESUDRAFT_719998 [Laetiporus sulphureus 93-53]
MVPPLPAAKIEEVLDIVTPHVGHWRAFHINVADYSLIHPALVRMSHCTSAPMLEVLKLYADEDLREDSVPSYAAG